MTACRQKGLVWVLVFLGSLFSLAVPKGVASIAEEPSSFCQQLSKVITKRLPNISAVDLHHMVLGMRAQTHFEPYLKVPSQPSRVIDSSVVLAEALNLDAPRVVVLDEAEELKYLPFTVQKTQIILVVREAPALTLKRVRLVTSVARRSNIEVNVLHVMEKFSSDKSSFPKLLRDVARKTGGHYVPWATCPADVSVVGN